MCSCRNAQLFPLFEYDVGDLVPFAHDLRERFDMHVELEASFETPLDHATSEPSLSVQANATTSADAVRTEAEAEVEAAAPVTPNEDENKTLQALFEMRTSKDDKPSGRKTKKTPRSAPFDKSVLFKQRGKFNYFPEHMSEALKAWFTDHILWPYPNGTETQELLFETGVTIRQLTNWFSNQRKRHWSAVFPNVVPQSRKAVEVFLIEKYGSIDAGVKRLLAL